MLFQFHLLEHVCGLRAYGFQRQPFADRCLLPLNLNFLGCLPQIPLLPRAREERAFHVAPVAQEAVRPAKTLAFRSN